MLDIFKLIARLWVMRRSNTITSIQADLYFALIQECNSRRWENPFACRNGHICELTGMSETAFRKARKRLVELGLIGYREGHVNHAAPVYKLYNTDADFAVDFPNHAKNSRAKNGSSSEEGAPNYRAKNGNLDEEAVPNYRARNGREGHSIGTKQNKTENETNFPSVEGSAGDEFFQASQEPTEEKEKSSAQKEKETTPHWATICRVWADFNKKQFDFSPSFKGRDMRCMKSIAQQLKARTEATGAAWSDETAGKTMLQFLTIAAKDRWLSQHFLLSNLENQFDKIINPHGANSNNQRNNQGNLNTNLKQRVFDELQQLGG